MVLPDANVLIYAFRTDTAHHAVCNRWLNRIVAADSPFGLTPLTLSALVRVTTNRRAYAPPSTLADAFGFCGDLRAQPNCRIVEPGERHWDIFRRLTIDSDTRGPMVTDAWFAALAIEHGCEWVTMDRDYARFPGLRWQTVE